MTQNCVVLRPGTVALGAWIFGALALIGVVMGVGAAMPAAPSPGRPSVSCGHLLDRRPSRSAGCADSLAQRRVEVAVAAGVAAAAAVIGLVSTARAMGPER